MLPLKDGYDRRITDLRILDHRPLQLPLLCYCKSADPMTHSKFEAMSLDEIVRLAGIFCGTGHRKNPSHRRRAIAARGRLKSWWSELPRSPASAIWP